MPACYGKEGLQVRGNNLVQESFLRLMALATALRGCGQRGPSLSHQPLGKSTEMSVRAKSVSSVSTGTFSATARA
jgi:predicted small lipoprotein YifL